MTRKIAISLPTSLQKHVDRRTQSGSYATAGEYILDLIRVDSAEYQRKSRDQLLLEALDDGPGFELSPQLRKQFISDLRADTRPKVAKKSPASRKKSA
jgi:Arc/MetJ-type ribon-helix-helix transcriptional regulator